MWSNGPEQLSECRPAYRMSGERARFKKVAGNCAREKIHVQKITIVESLMTKPRGGNPNDQIPNPNEIPNFKSQYQSGQTRISRLVHPTTLHWSRWTSLDQFLIEENIGHFKRECHR